MLIRLQLVLLQLKLLLLQLEMLLHRLRVVLLQPLLHYYAAVASTSAATVAVDTARRFQPPLLWRYFRSHRKKMCVIRIKTLPLLPIPAAVFLRDNYPHHIFPTACSSATVGRYIYLPPSPFPLYLYLWLRILRCISYDAIYSQPIQP